MSSFSIPKHIKGGCLCGGVRYEVNFSPDHNWERSATTCQCTMCRKNTGTLVYHLHVVSPRELNWLSKSTYAEYRSSETGSRAFCNRCGSPLGFIDHTDANAEIELAVGSIDEEFLVGERDEEDRPKGAFGKALANPDGGHFYVRNEVRGVTERVSSEGRKFWKATKEGPMEGQ